MDKRIHDGEIQQQLKINSSGNYNELMKPTESTRNPVSYMKKWLKPRTASTSARAVARLCARCDALAGPQVAFTSGVVMSTESGASNKKFAEFLANGGGKHLGQRGREEHEQDKKSLDDTERKNGGPSGEVWKNRFEKRSNENGCARSTR
eukprot:484742-Rhodomonas_salina.1